MRIATALLGLLVAVVGCAPPASPRPPHCVFVQSYTVDPEFTDDQSAAVRGAMASWGVATGGQACLLEGPGVYIHRVKTEAEAKKLDERVSVPGSLWGLWNGDVWIITARADTNRDVFSITVHELGHSMGLQHYEGDSKTFMHAFGPYPKEGGVTERDAGDFCRLHACPSPIP